MRRGKHYNLKTQLFEVISLLILFAVSLVCTVNILQFRRASIRQSSNQTQQLIQQISLNTGNYISELSRLCRSPYYSERIMKCLEEDAESDSQLLDKKREVEGFLKELMTIPRSDILRVSILCDDAAYFSSKTGYSAAYAPYYSSEPWYTEALSSSGALFLPAHTENHGGYTVTIFSMILRLQSLSDSTRPLGVIRVDANYNGIRDVLDDVELPEDSLLYIVDTGHSVIYSNRSPACFDADWEIISAALAGDGYISALGEKYYLNSEPISGTDWTIVEANTESELMKNIYSVQKLAVLLAVISILLGLVVTAFFVRSFVRPINETVEIMRIAQKGDLSARAPEARANEIDFLNQSFNDMLRTLSDTMDRNTRLTGEMYEAKYLRKKAQYNALHNQIKPHFLFNTLSTISLLIKCGNPDEAVQCVDELSTLLRGMVNTDKEITLSAEVRILDSYLSLQSRRHDSLRYTIDMDESVAECVIPALTLQPLVENAVIHGCEPTLDEILIQVRIVHDGSRVRITVRDNGVGMDPEQLSALKRRLSDSDTEPGSDATRGVGLQNSFQRLRLKYAEQLSYDIQSTRNEGTAIIISIPDGKNREDAAV